MNKILLTLLFIPFLVRAQTAPPIVQGSKLYQFRNGIKIDSALFLPRRDTTNSDVTMLAPGMIQWNPTTQRFNGRDSIKWVTFMTSLTGEVIDSAYRSNDTLFFRYASGGDLAVKMDYYTKGGADTNFIKNQFATVQAGAKYWVSKARADTMYVGGTPSGAAYPLYITGASAFTGSSVWNGGTYGSSTGINIGHTGQIIFKRYQDIVSRDNNGIQKLQFRRESAAGSSAATVKKGNLLGYIAFAGRSNRPSTGNFTEPSSIRSYATQDWDTSAYGSRIEFYTNKKGKVPPDDPTTVDPLPALIIEDNQNVGIGFTNANDTVYSGRLQLRSDTAGNTPFIWADDRSKNLKFSLEKSGQIKSPFYATQTPAGIVSSVLYVDAADSLIKVAAGAVGSPTVNILLPTRVFCVEGVEQNIYFDNVVYADFGKEDLKYDVVCGRGKQFNTRWAYTPLVSDSGQYLFTLNVYYRNELIATKSTLISATKRSAGSGVRNVLMIGDSQTANGFVPDTIKADYGSDALNLTFQGTVNTGGGNKVEAYGGWTWRQFVNPGSPFWNGSYTDVGNYLTANGLTLGASDWATIQLGTNDIFVPTDSTVLLDSIALILVRADTLINSIKRVNANIRIALVLPPPPSDQDAFGDDYSCGQTSWRFEYNLKRYQRAILEKYDNSSYISQSIYVLGANQNMDVINNVQTTVTQVNARNPETYYMRNNGVHPANIGYAQIADTYYGMFKWFK